MAERKHDKLLNIRTTGIREWKDKTVAYNRYEPTPYTALDKLFQSYTLDTNDKVVDFGCGRGRVTFYIHNRFQVPVTGVEVNDKTYDEALDNKASYRKRAKHISAPIRLKYGLAEHYEVKETDNKFYFFNPFSVKIFKQVVNNIIISARENNKTVDIILYYPISEYKRYLNDKTDFKLLNKIRMSKTKDLNEKILIYRLGKE